MKIDDLYEKNIDKTIDKETNMNLKKCLEKMKSYNSFKYEPI